MCVLFMMCFSMINEKHGTSPGYKVARQRQSEKDKCCGEKYGVVENGEKGYLEPIERRASKTSSIFWIVAADF